jgi:hypothetical protein
MFVRLDQQPSVGQHPAGGKPGKPGFDVLRKR